MLLKLVAEGCFSAIAASFNQFFNDNSPITEFTRLFPMIPTCGIDVHIMKLRKCRFSIIHIFWCNRCAHKNPFAVIFWSKQQIIFSEMTKIMVFAVCMMCIGSNHWARQCNG